MSQIDGAVPKNHSRISLVFITWLCWEVFFWYISHKNQTFIGGIYSEYMPGFVESVIFDDFWHIFPNGKSAIYFGNLYSECIRYMCLFFGGPRIGSTIPNDLKQLNMAGMKTITPWTQYGWSMIASVTLQSQSYWIPKGYD